ncbi:alpha/beta hydrolase [uncultured Tateyamaria sp.]|uniref:alpha/beta fold hydrolase n=1 Tax=uncultured Tateyamaria sp. TaxID=455651 RepID=UPI002633428C|nr:alpha/beta hydrolase [uncultured Tateyamaria sp.]
MMWTTRPRSDVGPLAAITAGDGPTILLIHGVGLRAEAWGAQIDALGSSDHVVAVDVPGHGSSAGLRVAPDLSAYTETIAKCLTGPTVVIGHSFGAMIALDLAMSHTDHVAGVAALNAIYRRPPDARTAVMARARSLDGVTIADPTAPLDRWFGPDPSPERAACENWLLNVDPAGYKAAYSVFAQEDGPADTALRSLPCPALFMTGAAEPNSTPEMSRAMAALAPNGRAVVIPGAAHMMPMTHAEQVNAQLASFIRECLP